MDSVATLIGAISGLITALTGAGVLVYKMHTDRKKMRKRNAAYRALQEIKVAAADGKVTNDEIAQILAGIEEQEDDDIEQ